MRGPGFIFGLGCGIILMTVIFYGIYSFGISGNATASLSTTMTEEEIIDQATKLGMIFFDTLPSVNEPAPPHEIPIQEKTKKSEEERIEEEENEEVVNIEQEQPEKSEESELLSATYLDIMIPPGTWATDIAVLLQERGIVDDGEKFLDFVKAKNLTKKLRNGYFQLPVQGDYEEILNILTKKRSSP